MLTGICRAHTDGWKSRKRSSLRLKHARVAARSFSSTARSAMASGETGTVGAQRG